MDPGAPRHHPYYALHNGPQPGVYSAWASLAKAKSGLTHPVFGKFQTETEASHFVMHGVPPRDNNPDTLHLFVVATPSSYAVVIDVTPRLHFAAPSWTCESTSRQARASAGVLKGILVGLDRAKDLMADSDPRPVVVHLDNLHSYNSVARWLPGWIRTNWTMADDSEVPEARVLSEIHELVCFLGGPALVSFCCHAKSKKRFGIAGMIAAREDLSALER